MATYVRNCYGSPSRLFVTGGKEIASSEGTTQGDPLAMPAYAVGIVPLLPLIKLEDDGDYGSSGVKHAAYADDLGGAGALECLRIWWDRVLRFGPLLGYFPKASKSWLVVKEDKLEAAKEIFAGSDINVTSEGHEYLGGYIGTSDSRERYVQTLVEKWVQQLEELSKIALSEPQAAYAAFVTGFQNKLSYHLRTIPNLGPLLKPVDDVINRLFLPAITEGYHCSTDERKLLSLPTRLGGLGISIFSEISQREFAYSKTATEQLSSKIKTQDATYAFDYKVHIQTKNMVVKTRNEEHQNTLGGLRVRMNKDLLRANDLAQMKGASSWLTSLPLKSEGYTLNKREFHDAIRMRYRWQLKYLPTTCACGKGFSIDHAMSCCKGGFIHQRHNEVRDLLGNLATEISSDVEIEPPLLPVTGERLHGTANVQDDARLDISVRGFWLRGQRAFFDVRVFNPFAPSYQNQKLTNAFRANEREKKRAYGQRVVDVEHGSFTPLVFTPYGGSSRETEKFISVLSSLIADKRRLANSIVTNWIRSKLSFALVRSAILCVRGSRCLRKKVEFDPGNIEIACATSKF